MVLDDHTITAQTIRSSPNVAPMEKKAISWMNTLFHVQEILEQWVKVQASYLYLEPIFNSEDIVRKLPNEASDFLMVDKMWKEIMEVIKEDTLVLKIDT